MLEGWGSHLKKMRSFTIPIFVCILLLVIYFEIENVSTLDQDSNEISEGGGWIGKWFPHPPGEVIDANPVVELKNLHDNKHGIVMGVASASCDDGMTNLTLDWDNSPIDNTCFRRYKFVPDLDLQPILHCSHIPVEYLALHKCMDSPIHYKQIIPTFGTHRPLWPQYGEYKFVPRQRWIHNLEHGAIVMLYHPCANQLEVNLLRVLVTGCLYRHIITPYNLLSPERPLTLVAWGCRLEMSKVDVAIVLNFIKSRALQGPEKTSREGQFTFGIKKHAELVSDQDDSQLCPV